MTTFEQFLRDRYSSLRNRRTELHAQLKAIQEEIDEIEKASKASGVSIVTMLSSRINETIEEKETQPKTMKEASIHILREHPGGLLATEILPKVNNILGTSYPRSSLSPQLSRLKRDGIVFDENGRWILLT